MSIALRIADGFADLFSKDGLNPRIYKRLFDLENLGSRRGDKAINVKLPRTAQNSALLGHIDSPATAGNFFAARSYSAAIVADGQELLAGRLYIEAITPDAFECSLTGANISWVDALRGLNARELPLRCVNYTGTTSAQIASLSGVTYPPNSVSLYEVWQAGVEGYDFAVPLIAYGNYPCQVGNTALSPINGVLTIEESAGVVDGAIIDNSQANPLSVFDFLPSPYVRAVLRSAMQAAGYLAAGDVFSDPYFEGLCLPPTSERADIDAAFNVAVLLQGTINYNLSNTNVFIRSANTSGNQGPNQGQLPQNVYYAAIDNFVLMGTPGPQNPQYTDRASLQTASVLPIINPTQRAGTTNGLIAANLFASQAYRVQYSCSLYEAIYPGVTIGVPVYGIAVLLALSEEELQSVADGSFAPIPEIAEYINTGATPTRNAKIVDFFELIDTYPAPPPTTGFELTADGFFNAGTYLVPMIFLDSRIIQGTGTGLANRAEFFDTSLSVRPSTTESTALCPSGFLPDMQADELVRAIVQHFNLYVSVNEDTRTVFFNTRSTYFFGNETAYDWTEKTNEKVLTARPPDYYRRIALNYAQEDSEPLFTAGQFDAIFEVPGTYYTEELVRDSLFAATGLRNFVLLNQDASISLNSLGDDDEYAKQLGELATGQEARRYDYEPRIVRYVGLQEVTPGPDATQSLLWVDNVPIGRDYASGGFSGPIIIPLTRFDGAQTLSYADRPGPRQGLLRRFFEAEFNQVAASVVVEVAAMLDNADVLALDVRRPVRIGRLYYIINEVQGYNPATPKPTTVTLIRK